MTSEVRSPRFPSSKFSRPGLVPYLVPRSRLYDALDFGWKRRLTVVAGAPGAGKTTLLAEWAAGRPGGTAAWVRCDAADADPVRFVVALIEAMSRAFDQPELGASARQLLSIDREVSIDALADLADDIEDLGENRVLVIDDFHLVQGESEEALRQLVEFRPTSLQIIVASRLKPNVRLHRMRANEEVVELHDRDLAFSFEETQALLTHFGLQLSRPDLAQVQDRTEGWPAGVQMAAISMQATAGVVTSGPDVHSDAIAGYFLEEVLYRQPPHVVEFMLATSVLDELSVAACTALVGADARAILDHLYAAHLFVTPSNERGEPYRYHQLVREVLRNELHLRRPDREVELHEAAARHFAGARHASLAARHLLEAGKPDQAFALLGDHVAGDLLTHPTTASHLDLDDLRPELFEGRPEVLVPLAAELLWRDAFDSGARCVSLAQRCPIDEVSQPELALRRALVTMVLHTYIGEFDEALRQREVASSLEGAASGVDEWVTAADILEMFCRVRLGELGPARAIARRLVATDPGVPMVDAACTGALSQGALLEGQLHEAGELADRSLDAARRVGFDRHFITVQALLTRSQLALERRELDEAARSIEDALAIVGGARPVYDFLAQLQRARIWAAAGNEDAALASMPALRSALRSRRAIALAEADELEARLRLSLGDHGGARALAARLPDPRRVVTGAIIALAASTGANVLDADRALRSFDGRPTTTRLGIELQLLRAHVGLRSGRPGARRQVRQAVEAAQSHGFHQTILDTAPELIDDVLDHPGLYPTASTTFGSLGRARLESASDRRRRIEPIDPLTKTELTVLRKLADRKTSNEIAAELYVSPNTVKTHIRHVYAKLGVGSRSAAITRASTLGLL